MLLLLIGVFGLFCANLLIGDVKMSVDEVMTILSGGSVTNDSWSYIVESRLYRTITAIFAGGALGVAGLILQVYFRNPLAGPGVLGVTSGASLGVAVVILGGLSMGTFMGNLGIVAAGIIGATMVLILLLFLTKFIHNALTVLVIGLMFGYFTSGIINILYLAANTTDTRAYVLWGMGSFEGLTSFDLIFFISVVLLLCCLSLLLIKPLNGLVVGNDYAASLGINLKRTRTLIVLVTGVLAAIVTVFCGPISFIGIAVPQVMRLVIKSKNHLVILPLVFIGGSFLALIADVSVRLSSNLLPLNTVTALIGAPIICWIIVKMNRKNAQF
ncbi:MAG: iron ABC transporter permease [Crocinitomix sp.]|nr:iron ABC transporter permease [Crocinitomix sp.]